MKQSTINLNVKTNLQRLFLVSLAIVLALATMLSTVLNDRVNAATLTSRSVTISSSEISQTGVTYDFDFTTVTGGGAIQGIHFQFCDSPLGTCNAVAGLTVVSATVNTQSGWSQATAFTDNGSANEGACNEATNTAYEFCAERAEAGVEAAGAKSITLDTITNGSSETTVYIRVGLYSDTAFASAVDDGVVAAAFVQQLTVTGRVQERLRFCVAAVGDADALPTDVSSGGGNCVSLTDTSIDIGVIDSSAAPSMAPVDSGGSTLGTDDYGIAMINTNAGGGTAITFFAEDPTSVSGGDTDQLKAFRVVPTDCNATASITTDQCFQSAASGGTGTTTLAGEEWFGLYVPCATTSSGVVATALTVDGDFDGFDDVTAEVADCENADKSDNGGQPNIGWNSGTTATSLASRNGVIDDAILKLSFVAQAAATTPTGTYTVVSTYIATPTF